MKNNSIQHRSGQSRDRKGAVSARSRGNRFLTGAALYFALTTHSALGANKGLLINNHSGNFSVHGTTSVTNTLDRGIDIQNSSGTFSFSSNTTVNMPGTDGVFLSNNTGATINLNGGLDIDTTSGAGFSATGGGTLNVSATAGDESIATTTGQAIHLNGVAVGPSGISFDSVTVDGAATGIALNGVSSSGGGVNLAATNLQNVTSRGVDIAGTLGATITFTDLDISLNNTSAVGFDLNGAAINAAVSAGDFDITNNAGAGTSIGIDAAGATGAGNIQLGDTNTNGGANASVAGTHSGAEFSSATNLSSFTFGDGSDNSPDGAVSSINAVVPITTTNTFPTSGSYNFLDATLTGDTSNLGGVDFFVFDNLATAGAGTFADPGTAAQAEAATADVLVMIDSTTGGGSNDIALGTNTLNLDNAQGLIGLTAGASFDVSTIGLTGGGPPASFLFSGVGGGSTITAPGAGIDSVLPRLTANAGTITVDLAGSAGIGNARIHNPGTTSKTVNYVRNSGTHDVTILSSTITGADDSLFFETQGSTSLTVTVADSTFTFARGDLIQINAINNSTQNITIRNNTFNNTNGSSLGGGITISGGGAGSNINVTYDISGTTPNSQTFRGAVGSAITVNYVNGDGTVQGAIQNNKIGVSGVAGSGSSGGSGISVGAAVSVRHSVTINNNDIDGISGFAGIEAISNSNNSAAAGGVFADISNNVLNEFGGFAFAGVSLLTGGVGAGDTSHMCAHISGNTIDASGSVGLDYSLDTLSTVSTMTMPGYPGGSVTTFLDGQNTINGFGGANNFPTANISGAGTQCVP